MRANEALEKHATFVMATLDETISHIDNYDFVKNLTDRTGSSHQRFSDFQKENFKVSYLPCCPQYSCLDNYQLLLTLWEYFVQSENIDILTDYTLE